MKIENELRAKSYFLTLKRLAGIVLGIFFAMMSIPLTQANEIYPKGKRMYENTCALCHEVDVGPNLLGRELPTEFITYIVRNGFQAMPAFPHTHVDEETLLELAQYISASPASEQGAEDE